MLNFFVSWFTNYSLVGVALALVFGAFWLVGYWPPLFKRYWLWAVMAGSAILCLVAVSFIQLPLQMLCGQVLGAFWTQEVLISWLLLAGIPQILASGLVQEGAKMVPMVVWWSQRDRKLSPKEGLIIGAVAGAGFGIFEAVWAHNLIFASGWSWATVDAAGFAALFGFWERLSAVAFHIGISALAGYGLARGWGWQFYLLAAGVHSLMNYSVILLQKGILTSLTLEIYASVIAVVVMVVALWLRWCETETVAEPPSLEQSGPAS
jgi:RsiW-degrading membrane proteinase PrsW (M82 family)